MCFYSKLTTKKTCSYLSYLMVFYRKRWYCKVWAEWDGKIANRGKIEKKMHKLTRLRFEAEAQQKALEASQRELFGVSEEAESFKGLNFFSFLYLSKKNSQKKNRPTATISRRAFGGLKRSLCN